MKVTDAQEWLQAFGREGLEWFVSDSKEEWSSKKHFLASLTRKELQTLKQKSRDANEYVLELITNNPTYMKRLIEDTNNTKEADWFVNSALIRLLYSNYISITNLPGNLDTSFITPDDWYWSYEIEGCDDLPSEMIYNLLVITYNITNIDICAILPRREIFDRILGGGFVDPYNYDLIRESSIALRKFIKDVKVKKTHTPSKDFWYLVDYLMSWACSDSKHVNEIFNFLLKRYAKGNEYEKDFFFEIIKYLPDGLKYVRFTTSDVPKVKNWSLNAKSFIEKLEKHNIQSSMITNLFKGLKEALKQVVGNNDVDIIKKEIDNILKRKRK